MELVVLNLRLIKIAIAIKEKVSDKMISKITTITKLARKKIKGEN